MRTKPSDITTTVDRELIAVERSLRDDMARMIGKLHSRAGHKGTARNCPRCAAEYHRQRAAIVTTAENEAPA